MWQRSKCITGWLHDFRQVTSYKDGVIEMCDRCKKKKFFSNKVPNYYYLSYHLRSALQPTLKRFYKEYERK